MCSEGGGKEESRFSHLVQIQTLKSAIFALVILATINTLKLKKIKLHVFISNLLSPASRQGRDFVGWEEQGPRAVWALSKFSELDFVDYSVRAPCDHSKACQIEHELECGLGEQVKTRSTIRLGRIYETNRGS